MAKDLRGYEVVHSFEKNASALLIFLFIIHLFHDHWRYITSTERAFFPFRLSFLGFISGLNGAKGFFTDYHRSDGF